MLYLVRRMEVSVISKSKYRVLAVMAFGVALVTSAIMGGSTQCEELALLQDSMRELRRTNNLEFSYASTIESEGMAKREQIVVWADQLTGSWVSEHYTTDEDGTRLYLKRFCDGRRVYHYIDWSGEWEIQVNENTDIPYLDRVIDLPYDSDDIMNIQLRQKVDVQELSYEFTQAYIDTQNEMRQENLEAYYENYQLMQTDEEGAERVELAVEQYRQTREADTTVTYRIDAAGVMRGLSCSMNLISPEITYDLDGEATLGEEHTSTYEIEIEVNRYNQEGVLNKIDQCRNEAAYYVYE